MKKADLKEYIREGDLKTLALLLLRIVNHLRNNKLKNAIDQNTARYNRLTNSKIMGEVKMDEYNIEINRISSAYIEIVDELPNVNFPFRPPETEEEVEEVLGNNFGNSIKNKKRNIAIFILLISIIITLSVLLFFKPKNNPIDIFEDNFHKTFIHKMFPYNENTQLGDYEGLWEIDTELMGYINDEKICYNILDSIGSYQNKRMIFYPIKSTMKVWSVSDDVATSPRDLRGIEFVRASVMLFKKNERVRKLTAEEIKNRTVAELGIIISSHFQIKADIQQRKFFTMAHQISYSKEVEKDDRLKFAIDNSINQFSNHKMRYCTEISTPEKKNDKILFYFRGCDLGNDKYIRTLKKRN